MRRALTITILTGALGCLGGSASAVAAATPSSPALPAVPATSTALYGSDQLAEESLPAAGLQHPGPTVLYAPLPVAPQLENAPGSIWRAPPILISGASAYRDGEFLYQDFLFDDHGGGGTYTYPTGPAYASQDLADLVEVRLKLTSTGTAFRITYNAMSDPNLVATTIAMGDSGTSEPLPFGAGATEPATIFATVHGGVADITNADSGASLGQVPAQVDTVRRQVQVIVPFSAYDPRGLSGVRIAAATGLWNPSANRYDAPNAFLSGGAPTATTPGGGAGLKPTAIVNAAFRYGELQTSSLNPIGTGTGGFGDAQQSKSLAQGDLSPFNATVDFQALAAGTTNEMLGVPGGTPQTGSMVRIYASQFTDPQGRGQPSNNTPGCTSPCTWQYGGQLQPYELYIPAKPPAPNGYGLTLDLHSCGTAYTFDYGDTRQQQLGNRGSGSIVITPESRGGCYWYVGQAGTAPFEIWDDLAHRYRLDPSNVALTGISMGGYGTYRLAEMFPDLFAAIAPVVPCPSAGTGWGLGKPPPGGTDSVLYPMIPSLRNVPVITWMSTDDEYCVYAGPQRQMDLYNELDSLGYQYSAWSFTGLEHDTFAAIAESQSGPLANYLGSRSVTVNPAHVSYVLNGAWDDPSEGLNADHAYWISGLTLRNPGGSPPIGTIDVFSAGFGTKDPAAQPTTRATAVLSGALAPVPYSMQGRIWSAPGSATAQNVLDITATNIATVTIDAARAHTTCHPQLSLHTDGPLKVSFVDCPAGQPHKTPSHHRKHRHKRKRHSG